MAKAKYNLNKAVVFRFLRVAVPQIPTVTAILLPKVPEWVGAILVFVGAGLTALDKFLRERGVYGGK